MKNYEKYVDEIRNYKGNSLCCDFIKPHILKLDSCGGLSCNVCHMLQTLWLLEEYEEPRVDWSEVEVDTPILVTNFEDGEWRRRYFAKFEDGKVYAWANGRTSWSSDNGTYKWNYAKLEESNKR